MNNQKTKYVLFLLLGILDCDAKMGNETAGYYCITFKIVAFGNIEESTFEQHRGIAFELQLLAKLGF